MVALHTPMPDPHMNAIDFALPGTDGNTYRLADVMGEKGLVVMFICNHCPYVQAVMDKLVRDTAELKALGIGSVAIMPNDVARYPLDGPENMKKLAEQKRFPFPYLFDATQEVAKAYGAVCTPDFFGFNATGGLVYRGRLDDSEMSSKPNAPRELFEAMKEVAATGRYSGKPNPSVGCSIKWKQDQAASA